MGKMRMRFGESKRMMRLLEKAPAPAPWGWNTYPRITGPDGKSLVWKEDQHVVKLVEKDREEVAYLGLGFYCYVQRIDEDRLLVWYHIGRVVSPSALRIHLVYCSSLRPIERMPVYNNLVHDESSQVSYSGRQVSVDIPTARARGVHLFEFPDEMKMIDQLAVLVHGTDKPVRDPSSGFSGESVYILQPQVASIEVVPLDWWNDSDSDFGYLWIWRITLDPETGTLVGDGKGALPFLMKHARWDRSRWVKRDL